MSSKTEIHRKLKEIGYEIGSYASKDTLTIVMRLHSKALTSKNIDVSKLGDHDLRKLLTEHGLLVGPVTNHTRAIYQRKLLEVLTNETTEGREDDYELEEPVTNTSFRDRISITRGSDVMFSSDLPEPRIELTRVNMNDRDFPSTASPLYPKFAPTSSPQKQQQPPRSYSPPRQSSKFDDVKTRTSGSSFGLRDPYDFQNDEPSIVRHEHKATPFRTTNISSFETKSNGAGGDAIRYGRRPDPEPLIRTNTYGDSTGVRPRITATSNDQQVKTTKDSPPKKVAFTGVNQTTTAATNDDKKLNVAEKGVGTLFYGGITLVVALIVFVLYLWLEK